MPRGRRSLTLTEAQRRRLNDWRLNRGYDITRLKACMPEAPFKLATLKSALDGKPVWEVNAHWLLSWMDEHCAQKLPPAPAILDGKSRGAGEAPEQNGGSCE